MLTIDIVYYMTKCAVLIHGLSRSKLSMHYLGRQLLKSGYRVINFGYKSRRCTISEQADILNKYLSDTVTKDEELYFVTHSLGSLVLRQFAHIYSEKYSLQRAVMLGPPNQGALIAKKLSSFSIMRMFFGPALSEIADLNLPEASDKIEIGIVAGGRDNNKGMIPIFKGDNDGIVKVEETHLPGAKDHILMTGLHSFLMYHPKVIKQVINFFDQGTFER